MKGRLATLLLFLVLAFTLHGQTWRGVISGSLTDAAGAAVPSATISITESSTQRVRTAATNSEGVFTLSSLAPGEYVIAIERPGIQPLEQKVTLLVNQDVRVDLKLIRQQSERM